MTFGSYNLWHLDHNQNLGFRSARSFIMSVWMHMNESLTYHGDMCNNEQRMWQALSSSVTQINPFTYICITGREIFMKQSVGKCKQINFYNLCVQKLPIEHSTTCDSRIHMNCITNSISKHGYLITFWPIMLQMWMSASQTMETVHRCVSMTTGRIRVLVLRGSLLLLICALAQVDTVPYFLEYSQGRLLIKPGLELFQGHAQVDTVILFIAVYFHW